MKKLVGLVLVTVMLLSFSGGVFASFADINNENNLIFKTVITETKFQDDFCTIFRSDIEEISDSSMKYEYYTDKTEENWYEVIMEGDIILDGISYSFNASGEIQGHEGYDRVPPMKVSVTGCGSVGSFLIQSLVQLGISEFSLIDKDYLTSENIARHICGAEDLELGKTEAVKNKLIKHYPYLKLNSHYFDLWSDLDRAIKIYEEQDYNFIVVGNMAIENKLIEMFNNKVISKPLVILWVEPFLLGGHAIILQYPMKDTSSIYNHEFSFVNKVLENGHKYIRKESGCESTFIPYSAIEIQMFILSFLDYFNENFIQSQKKGNYLFSWGGKLSWARENSYALTSKWLGKKDRSVIIKRLDE